MHVAVVEAADNCCAASVESPGIDEVGSRLGIVVGIFDFVVVEDFGVAVPHKLGIGVVELVVVGTDGTLVEIAAENLAIEAVEIHDGQADDIHDVEAAEIHAGDPDENLGAVGLVCLDAQAAEILDVGAVENSLVGAAGILDVEVVESPVVVAAETHCVVAGILLVEAADCLGVVVVEALAAEVLPPGLVQLHCSLMGSENHCCWCLQGELLGIS